MRKIFTGVLLVGCCVVIFSLISTGGRLENVRTSSSNQEPHIPKPNVVISLNVVQELNVDKDARNIFFLETSSFGGNPTGLNPRQACAVESAAKMNPNMAVNLLLLEPSELSYSSKDMAMQLLQYDNVKIQRINIDDYVKKTPLEHWDTRSVVKKSQWPTSHMSDVLRYLTLWKFSGIYMDLDVVVTTSLNDLTNFSGAEDAEDIDVGVVGFSSNDFGREIANKSLMEIKNGFRGDIWGWNGPGVLTRIMQKMCGVKTTTEMTPDRCHGFQVFPPSVFYPIHYTNWRQYFEEKNSSQTMQILKQARAIHVWNKLSSQEKVYYGSNVPYALIAKQFCPKVYDNCGNIF